MIAGSLLKAITADFIQPTSDKLSADINRTVIMQVRLKIDDKAVGRRVISEAGSHAPKFIGTTHIRAKRTSTENKYKFILQCIFSRDRTIKDISGFQTNGYVFLGFDDATINHAGCTYSHNDWLWRPTLINL